MHQLCGGGVLPILCMSFLNLAEERDNMNRDNKEWSLVNMLSKVRNPTGRNKVEGIPGIIITLIAISWSVFHLYTGYLPLMAMYQRIIFVGFAMVLIFLIFPIWGREQPKQLTIHGLALAAVAVGILVYLWINYTARALTIGMITYTTDLVFGGYIHRPCS